MTAVFATENGKRVRVAHDPSPSAPPARDEGAGEDIKGTAVARLPKRLLQLGCTIEAIIYTQRYGEDDIYLGKMSELSLSNMQVTRELPHVDSEFASATRRWNELDLAFSF